MADPCFLFTAFHLPTCPECKHAFHKLLNHTYQTLSILPVLTSHIFSAMPCIHSGSDGFDAVNIAVTNRISKRRYSTAFFLHTKYLYAEYTVIAVMQLQNAVTIVPASNYISANTLNLLFLGIP